MKQFFKDPVVVIIFLPIAFLLLIWAVVSVPRLFVYPEYDFVFASVTGSAYYAPTVLADNYRVTDNQLDIVMTPADAALVETTRDDDFRTREKYSALSNAQLYIYDVSERTHRAVTIDEAQALRLDSDKKSPDGFILETDNRNDYGMFDLFSMRSNRGQWSLKKNGVSVAVDLDNYDRYYPRGVLIGWVIE